MSIAMADKNLLKCMTTFGWRNVGFLFEHRLHSPLRYFCMSGPEQRIQDQLSERVDLPVGIVVSFGEAEAAAAVFAVDGPGDDGLSAGGFGVEGEEGGEARIRVAEMDFPVVLGFGGEGFDAGGDGVGGGEEGGGGRRGGEGGVPGVAILGVAGRVIVEVAADPVLELFAAAIGGDEDGVVDADEADAAIH